MLSLPTRLAPIPRATAPAGAGAGITVRSNVCDHFRVNSSNSSDTTRPLHRNAALVRAAATAAGLDVEIREFPDGTRTAEDAANAIGVEVGQIVKSLVFGAGTSKTDDDREIVMALVSGANQLDERKLAHTAGVAATWRVDADAVREATGFPVGGVAPIGHSTALRLWVDEDLLRYDVVWAAAGTPSHVFSVAPDELIRATGAVTADLAKRAATR
jgi:prolyl-tRNA editing enzyme YbaK/EbsC (Cys-tRNA(Pro) deacylase)